MRQLSKLHRAINLINKIVDGATLAYLEKNRHRASLPRLMLGEGKPRSFPGRSAIHLLWLKIFSLRALLGGIAKGFFNCSKLSRLTSIKKTGSGKSALVLGNGPSQGYLDPHKLLHFVKQNNHLFVVNFYNNNKTLCSICPSYHVISDPNTLNPSAPSMLTDSNSALRQYFLDNKEITICVPMDFDLDHEFEDRTIYFNDIEACWWSKNINPMFPRGYLSSTLYKALAMACFIGYDNIYVLGMDNTYPHDIFVDNENNIWNVERHAGGLDHLIDQSPFYKRIEDVLWDLCFLFSDLQLFKDKPVVNLDPYSLTSTFPKADPDTAMNFLFDEIVLTLRE